MSAKAMTWALEQTTESPVDKLLLIAIANYGFCPSLPTLQRIAVCDLRTLDQALQRIEGSGKLVECLRLCKPDGGDK